jgi:branched-chain amino acid aminotransferase
MNSQNHAERQAIRIERSSRVGSRPKVAEFGFGRVFSDHLFRASYDPERGWHDAVITARAPLVLDPAATVLQYGQMVFEGLKAFAAPDGRTIRLFRVDAHARRFVASARRLCLPEVTPDDFVRAVSALVNVDADHVPRTPDASLYLRPTLLGTEGFLGVRPSATAEFFVLASPVGAYWQGGRRPLRLWVETELSRAAPGGTGAAKCGGNYAASLLAAERAKSKGYDQVLWTDARAHTTLEEVGTMNAFVRIGDTVITPPLDGTILAGVTRDSVLTLLRAWGVKVEERSVSIAEIEQAAARGALEEMFGTGTAAVIAPIGELGLERRTVRVGDGGEGELTRKLYDAIRAVQTGEAEDRYGWLTEISA